MTRRSPATATILALIDQGETPAQVVAAGHSKDLVYKVLRRERPDRARAPRSPTSHVPALVERLRASGVSVARVAALLKVTPQYVYRLSKPALLR